MPDVSLTWIKRLVNSPLLFIPAAICLLITVFGFACLTGTALVLRKRSKNSALNQPDLPDSHIGAQTRSTVWWKRGFRLALLMLITGLAGLWATGFSIGWIGNSPREWSDSQAPAIEPLIRNRCVPFLQQSGSIGMTVAVVTPAQSTVMAFGSPSLTSSRSIRDDTIFEIGSITKTFTAIALARTIEQGAMRLDQPIQELLPPDVELPVDARAVTLRHLTTHSSGFPRLPGDELTFVPGALKMLLFGSDPYAGFSEADLLASLRSVKLDSHPGSESEYSNFGVTVLGYLLARNAGVDYGSLVTREVCRPLGMDHTTVTIDSSQAEQFAQGYRAAFRYGPLIFALRSNPWNDAPTLGGAGSLRSTGRDMLRYLHANMRPAGSPIEQAIRESHRELFRKNERRAFGMNWVRTQSKELKKALVWHNGGTGGFRSFLGFTEDGQTGVLILSNAAHSVDDLALDLLRDLGSATSGGVRIKEP